MRSDKEKVLFVYNPYSGQVQIRNYLWDILNILSMEDYDLTVKPTTDRMDAYEIVKETGKYYSKVICSGGDGTLNEVVNGLMEIEKEKRPVLGYIPAGSTNDYGTSLKLSKNMRRAAEFCVVGNAKTYDIGKFNDRCFVYVAAFGLFSEVSYETDQQIKNAMGHFAYVIEGAKSLSSFEPVHLKIRTADREEEDDYIFGMITNSLSVGGIYKMKESDVDLSDGLFEVLLVKLPKKIQDLTAINNFLLGIGDASGVVEVFKTDHIIIECDGKMGWALDGEDGGTPEVVDISVIDQAIRIIS